MVDHGVLDCERAAGGGNALVVGRAVLTAIGDGAVLERLLEARNRAILGARSRHDDVAVRAERVDQAHRRRRHEIDLVGRALDDGDVGANARRCLGSLRYDEEALAVRGADKAQPALELIDCEVLRVLERHRARRLPPVAQIGVVEVGRLRICGTFRGTCAPTCAIARLHGRGVEMQRVVDRVRRRHGDGLGGDLHVLVERDGNLE